MDYLAKRISFPLEREYEAWIVDQIERYFRRLGVPVAIFAVSPVDEATWPADEVVDLRGKVVGLQFKKPTLAVPSKPNDFSRLHWSFSKPAGQLQRVVANPEIFYCLPTFMNRDVRPRALHHCLFWRPQNGADNGAWYDNKNLRVKTQHATICDAPRWGLFVERFIGCTIGRLLGGQSFSDYMRSMAGAVPSGTGGVEDATTIQMLVLKGDTNRSGR